MSIKKLVKVMMERRIISQVQLVQQLLDLGVKSGMVVLLHCSFSQVKPIEGGPQGLITALRTVLGADGTLVMPSMTDDDDHPFDPLTTPCMGMGVVANTFWQLPNVLRSDSPHAFAATGTEAARVTMPHPADVPHGLDSPVGRVYELNGHVLLLGVDHGSNTTIHLAEYLAGVRYRRRKTLTLRQNGILTWLEYEEIDHCCQNFTLTDGWLEAKKLQKRGRVGHAEARFMRSQDVAVVVKEQLEANETVFLHPFGVDEECDEARASLPSP